MYDTTLYRTAHMEMVVREAAILVDAFIDHIIIVRNKTKIASKATLQFLHFSIQNIPRACNTTFNFFNNRSNCGQEHKRRDGCQDHIQRNDTDCRSQHGFCK